MQNWEGGFVNTFSINFSSKFYFNHKYPKNKKRRTIESHLVSRCKNDSYDAWQSPQILSDSLRLCDQSNICDCCYSYYAIVQLLFYWSQVFILNLAKNVIHVRGYFTYLCNCRSFFRIISIKLSCYLIQVSTNSFQFYVEFVKLIRWSFSDFLIPQKFTNETRLGNSGSFYLVLKQLILIWSQPNQDLL